MNTLIKVLKSDMTATRWTMGWLSVILSFGLLFSASDTSSYRNMLGVADSLVWAVIFFAHGLSLLLSALYNLPCFFKKFCHGIGVWLWTYLFLNFTFYDETTIGATEWMMVLPIVLEIWMLSETPKPRKKND